MLTELFLFIPLSMTLRSLWCQLKFKVVFLSKFSTDKDRYTYEQDHVNKAECQCSCTPSAAIWWETSSVLLFCHCHRPWTLLCPYWRVVLSLPQTLNSTSRLLVWWFPLILNIIGIIVHLSSCLCVQLHLDDISRTTQPFLTKLGIVVYNEVECHPEEVVYYLHCQWQS